MNFTCRAANSELYFSLGAALWTKTVRILHIIASANPADGGPIEGVKQLAGVLTTMGHEVELVCLDDPDAVFLRDLAFPHYALGPAWFKYAFSARLLPWLRTHVDNYDSIIVNGLWQYHCLATWLALRRSVLPYFVFTHGMLDPWFKHAYPLKHLKKCLYWPWGQYPALRDARGVLFTCDEERRLARQSFKKYRCREMVVNYGTSPPEGDATKQRELFLSQYPELQKKRIMLFLSRIHEKKGCDLLIKAFAEVAQDQHDLHLVVAGPDQTGWQKQLLQLSEALAIDDRITWTGMLSGDLKWGAYLSAEAFVLPSHQENFGIVVSEALACGTPVLISNKVNIWREIASDSAGFVDDDTVEGTVRNLQRWLKLLPDERQRLASNAEQCFMDRLHIRKAADSLVEIIQSAVHD